MARGHSSTLSRASRTPKFSFAPGDTRAFVDGIEAAGEPVFARPLAVDLSDPDDLPFLEVAAAGGADALVTGNARHYRPMRGAHQVPVLTPREFLDLITGIESDEPPEE